LRSPRTGVDDTGVAPFREVTGWASGRRSEDREDMRGKTFLKKAPGVELSVVPGTLRALGEFSM
jgi:hypothetical protein